MQNQKHPLLINLHKHVFMKKTDLGYEIEDEKIDVSRGFSKPGTTFFQDWESKHIVVWLLMVFFLTVLSVLKYNYNLP